MIHVDVKRKQHPGSIATDFIVETSTDGAGWKTQAIFPFTFGDEIDRNQRKAEDWADTFAEGCRYAGAITRVTSCGYHRSER